MHLPPPFDPAVTVSALALQNLSNLPFKRFTLATPPLSNPVSQRARWLEPGVGQSVALPAAAVSLLAEQLPSALAALLRPAPKSSKSPVLYVFGTRPTLTAATDLLRDAFSSEEIQFWTPQSPSLITRALTTAIHRAIVQAVEASGAIRVGTDSILPDANLSYSFNVALGHGKESNILIRLAVKQTAARRITDEDCAFALQAPFSVFAAPMGLSATLSPRPMAGDALTASVLKRWREAGLLPAGELSDSTVIFLTINGADVPFPRMAVLTNEAKNRSLPHKLSEKAAPKKASNTPTNLSRSKKRPRSPSAAEGMKDDNTPPKAESQPEATPFSHKSSHDIPTAASLNAALRAQGAQVDPAPTLRHPLVEPIAPPTCDIHEPDKAEPKAKVEEPCEKDADSNSASNEKDQISGKDQPEMLSTDVVKSEPSHPPTQSANGSDTFLLDGDGNTQDGFDTGPGMDMTDFGAFEDDVTEFFRDGMDERLPEVDNDSNLLDSDEINRSTGQTNQVKVESKDERADNSSGGQDLAKVADDMKMDVDVKAGSSGQPSNDPERRSAVASSISAIELVNAALSALRKPIPSTRPKRDAVKTQLSSFFEDDLTERRHVRFRASRTIGKRKPRNKSLGKLGSIELRAIQTRIVNERVTANEKSEQSKRNITFGEERSAQRFELPYVPKRKVKAYSSLRRKGVFVDGPAILEDDSLSDTSVSDADEGDTSEAIPGPTYNHDAFLSMEVPSGVSSHSTKTGTKSSSVSANRDELDSLKVADAVAIDCASACMVLAACTDLTVQGTGLVSNIGGSAGPQEGSGSPSLVREEEAKVGEPISLSHSASKAPLHSSLPKPPVAVNGSTLNRQPGKRDKEMFALLSLLEMQLFASNELSLFSEGNAADALTACTRKAKNSSDTDREHVSSATMRRVLLGLPRALETSDSFKSCLASFHDEDGESAMPRVKGPLSVNDFLGGVATVFPLASPRVCVGFNTEWIEASSGALPLWEKAGFEPYSERKNIEYVAVAPKDLDEDVKLFFRDLSAAYEECSFGKHVAMPFDAVTLIAHYLPKGNGNDKPKSPGSLSEIEKAMTEQYHLAVTGLCTKLAAVTRDHRKNPTGSPTNIVAYIISPFVRDSKAANVSLLRAVAPLVSTVPGTVPSMVGAVAPGPNLPAAPWRSSPASKSVVSVTVRVIPREVVDRKLSGRAEVTKLLRRPLRPQLMKAVSFAVFNSIRYKRVKVPTVDGETSSLLSRASLIPDELMSPMTPDIVVESPNGGVATPVSPIGPSSEDSGHGTVSVAHNGSLLDQSSALSPSFLHEPVVVLAGVGRHMNQTGNRPNIVLHLAYAFCESSSRYVFSWTDQRGEMLDTASVPVSRTALSSSRRKAFWGIWARGQRWRISYVDEVHTTIAKLGEMSTGEADDWDWVINKVISPNSGNAEKKNDSSSQRLLRRFPPRPLARSEDISESYTDVPTPATPALPASVGCSMGVKSPISMEIKMPSVASVTLLSVCSADSHLFLEKAGDEIKDRRDFAVVSDTSSMKGNVQANAILARFEDDGINAIEVNLLRHYGDAEEGEEMSDDRSPWDSYDVKTIANTIAVNFHELRYVATPPSWPYRRWLSLYPIHLDAVRGFKTYLKQVCNFAYMTQTSGTR